jgi:hypothetical protein
MGSQDVISNHKNALQHPSRTGAGTQLVESGLEHELIQFCMDQQRQRIPAIISDVIDYLAQKSITVDWWWVARFPERHEAELIIQKASVLERSQHEVAPDNVKRYFDILRERC